MAIKTTPKPLNWGLILVVLTVVILLFLGIGLAIIAKGDLSMKPAIAVIPIEGEIGINSDSDPTTIVKLIEKADKEITIKAIILDINSPGGSVVASKEIAAAVKNAEKPTVALIREVGASGAFWVATSADKVVADPASITGSIGVTSSYISFENLMQKYGITYNRLVTGKFKDAGTAFKSLTPEEREYILQKIYTIKDMFVKAIAESRNLPVGYVDNLADGSIWLGSEAKAYGMVDVLGGEKEAQEEAEKMLGVEESRLVRLAGKQPTLAELLSGNANSVAYWIGRGMGAELLALSNSKSVPEVNA